MKMMIYGSFHLIKDNESFHYNKVASIPKIKNLGL
jgi:hypothetical protein